MNQEGVIDGASAADAAAMATAAEADLVEPKLGWVLSGVLLRDGLHDRQCDVGKTAFPKVGA